jgi:hypothetical protein
VYVADQDQESCPESRAGSFAAFGGRMPSRDLDHVARLRRLVKELVADLRRMGVSDDQIRRVNDRDGLPGLDRLRAVKLLELMEAPKAERA